MKGLLIKDLELQKRNLKVYAAVFLMALFFLFSAQETSYFVVYYVTMMAGFLVLGTISYDDFDHGMSYLMTLPVTRGTYVLEKYLLGFILGIVGWLFSAVITAVVNLGRYPDASRSEMLITCMTALLLLCVLISFMIPIQLKFGAENGRIVFIGAMLGIAAVCYLVGYLLKQAGSISLEEIAQKLDALSPVLVGTGALLITLAIVLLSYRISTCILNKKEF